MGFDVYSTVWLPLLLLSNLYPVCTRHCTLTVNFGEGCQCRRRCAHVAYHSGLSWRHYQRCSGFDIVTILLLLLFPRPLEGHNYWHSRIVGSVYGLLYYHCVFIGGLRSMLCDHGIFLPCLECQPAGQLVVFGSDSTSLSRFDWVVWLALRCALSSSVVEHPRRWP